MVSELISGPSRGKKFFFAASWRLIGYLGAQRDQKGPMAHITPGPIQPLGGPAAKEKQIAQDKLEHQTKGGIKSPDPGTAGLVHAVHAVAG